MSSPTSTQALVHRPLQTFKLKPTNIRAPISHFSGEFQSPRFHHRRITSWGFNTMNGPIKISAFFNGNPDSVGGEIGGVDGGALEQEGLINGSSRISLNLVPSRFEATLNSMSKWLLSAIFVALVVIRHDAKVLWASMGSIVNVLLCILLKKIINQERPVSGLKPDPGMPSSHSQSIFFILLFAIISIIECLGTNGLTIALSGLTMAIGSYLSWLRVSQKLHTISQVLVGAAVGSIFSILWFWSWDTFLQEVYISSLWVRILILLGAAGCSLGFAIYAIRYWITDTK